MQHRENSGDDAPSGPMPEPRDRATIEAEITDLLFRRTDRALWNDPATNRQIDALYAELERDHGVERHPAPRS